MKVDNPGLDTTVPTLGEALPREMARVRKLPRRDVAARFALKYAEKAMKDGDVCRMLNALEALKAHK